MKTKLLEYLKEDADFKPYLNILDEVVENLDSKDYLLDKNYIDVSHILIDDFIIDLDSIYSLCKSYYD